MSEKRRPPVESEVPQLSARVARMLAQKIRRDPRLADAVHRKAAYVTDTFLSNTAGEHANRKIRSTLSGAARSLLLQFADTKGPVSRQPTLMPNDIKVVINGYYAKNDHNVTATAQEFNEFVTHTPVYYEEAKSIGGEKWEEMNPSQRLFYMQGVIDGMAAAESAIEPPTQ